LLGCLGGLGTGAQASAVGNQGVGRLFDLVRIHRLIGAWRGFIEDDRIVGARRASSQERCDQGTNRQARYGTRCHSSTVAQTYSPALPTMRHGFPRNRPALVFFNTNTWKLNEL
jgi:hypothetical protein